MITLFKYNVHTKPLFLKLNLLNVIDICNFQIGIFMFRYFHNQLPSVFDHYFSFNYKTHEHYTCSSSNYHLTGHMKGLCKSVLYKQNHGYGILYRMKLNQNNLFLYLKNVLENIL